MKAEVKPQTEWSIFDDAVIDYRGSWRDVVQQCVEARMFPTVIFYEKLDPNEQPPEVVRANEFNEVQLMQQFIKSKEADLNWSVGGLDTKYDQHNLAQQIELMNQLKSEKETTDNGDKSGHRISVKDEEVKSQQPQIQPSATGKIMTLLEIK